MEIQAKVYGKKQDTEQRAESTGKKAEAQVEDWVTGSSKAQVQKGLNPAHLHAGLVLQSEAGRGVGRNQAVIDVRGANM